MSDIYMCEECHKVQEKTPLKPFLTIHSPGRIAQTAIIGNKMENRYFEQISLKKNAKYAKSIFCKVVTK